LIEGTAMKRGNVFMNRKDEEKINEISLLLFQDESVGEMGSDEEILKTLNSISNVNIKNSEGETLLISASYYNRIQVVRRLIELGADVNAQNKNGYTALHVAAEKNFGHLGKILLENGADANATDFFGNTPLAKAVYNFYGDQSFIRLLVDNGAQKEQKNFYGVSPEDLDREIGVNALDL
ncbi:MAG: ankyrin repeat domain-containing protein, partial [Ethanoligenens sp.]